MNKFSYITVLSKTTNISGILAELSRHEQVLVGTDIERLIYFSRTYAIVNQNINLALVNGYFSNPVLVDMLQQHFADIYFEMLNNYARTGHMQKKWKLASKHKFINIQPASFSLFFAIRAHIQCDALEALRRLVPTPDTFADDYFRIETIILKSSEEIVSSYNPNSQLNLLRELARKIVIIPLGFVIFNWRLNAWNRFIILGKSNQRTYISYRCMSQNLCGLRNVVFRQVLEVR